MDLKKLIGAIVAAYIVLMGSNYLIHQVWLMPDYLATADLWRPMEAMRHRMWVMWVGQLCFAIFFAYIYTRGVEAKSWVGQGIRYGILVTLLAVVPASLSEYVVYNMPHQLAVKWMIAGCVQLIILGLIVAGITGAKRTAA